MSGTARARGRVGALVLAGAVGIGIVAVGSSEVQGTAGTPETLTGVVMEGHGDVFNQNKMIPGFHIHLSNGETVMLDGVPAAKAKGLQGKTVVASGTRRDGHLAVTTISATTDSGTSVASTTSTAVAAGTAVARRVAVIPFYFSDAPIDPLQPPFTTTAIRNAYFDGTASANTYYQDTSDDLTSLAGAVYDWVPISRTSTTTCDFNAWASSAKAVAAAQGFTASNFDYVSYVMPRQSPCAWAGLAYLAPGNESWMNGTISVSVVAHELGHNFGFHHASSMSCTDSSGVAVPISNTCTSSEYGDPFSNMGNGTRLQHNIHRRRGGWLTEVVTLTQDANVLLAPADSVGAGVRLVRIPRGGSSYLNLEFRQPTGIWDNFSSTAAVVSGITLRLSNEPTATAAYQTQLIDVTPSNGFSDPVLKPGQAFTDPVSGVTVVVRSVASTGASVDVSWGPDTVAPSAVSSLRGTVVGGRVDLAWTAATDNRAVTGYRVVRDGVLLGTTTSTNFSDSSAPAGQTAFYTVVAVDAAGNVGPSSSVSIVVPAPDTTAPSTPTNFKATVAKSRVVSLSWTASVDNVGVTGYVVTRNGVVISTVTKTSLTDKPGVGSHTYTVQARDAAGNLSLPATITVRV